MSYYEEDWYNEPYYEPTPADEIFFEAKQKLEECLKESIKYKLNSTIEENKRLQEENQQMKDKVSKIERKEKQIEQRENDMERTVLRRKFSEMLKPLEERFTIYRVDYGYVKGEKCDKCDKDRRIYYKTPSGKESYESCECDKSYKVWNVSEASIVELNLYKDKSKYPHKISITPKYEGASYDDTYCKFKLINFIEDFSSDNCVFSFEDLNYKEVGFKKIDDCQMYCNYLNSKENRPIDNTPIPPKTK